MTMRHGLMLLVGLASSLCGPVSVMAVDALTALDIRQVKVGGEIGRRIDVTISNNLLKIDVESSFLKDVREHTGRDSYVGIGKFIDGLSRLAAYSNDPNALALRQRVIDGVLKTQSPDGYIGIYKPEQRIWTLWDIHEMSYIIYALCTDARLFDNKAALEAARKLGDFILPGLQAQPNRAPTQYDVKLHVALTGFEQAFIRLSETTGDPKYRDFTVSYRKLPEWECPIEMGRTADIRNHAYSYICRCVAQLRLYRTMPDDRLLARSRDVLEFLAHGNGMVITGTCGDHECWHNTQAGTVNLGESCTTAYLIRWLDEQLRLTGDARLGDLMERAIYNALFAAQSPDGRQIRYYVPFDGPRAYFPKDSYCCPGNYRRIVSELPIFVYYRATDGVLVNLYAPSQTTIDLGSNNSLKLRQETEYPTSGKVLLHVEPSQPTRFAVKLRIPRWCERATALVQRDGTTQTLTAAGGNLLAIDREWKPGDRVELDMPMRARLVKGRVTQAGRFAVMYGPTVFCLDPKSDPELAKMDLRLLVAFPPSLKGPTKDESVRPNGLAWTLRAWPPGAWYPAGEPSVNLRLTEFADPDGVFTYFFTPNPVDPLFVNDELFGLPGGI